MSKLRVNHLHSVLSDQHWPRPQFWVVTCYFNPAKYRTRLVNFLTFAAALKKQRVNVLVVELTSDTDAHLTPDLVTKYVRVQQPDVLWAKERLLNIGIDALPEGCTQVCWLDADIVFDDPHWAKKCSRALRRHAVGQPFTKAVFLGKGETPAAGRARGHAATSFASIYTNTADPCVCPKLMRAHPGYGWAARRSVLRQTGGLYDRAILGWGDLVMGQGFCHSPSRHAPITAINPKWKTGWSQHLLKDLLTWQRHAAGIIDGDTFALDGTIIHHYHGSHKGRQYHTRGALLADFDHARDLQLSNVSGMWAWTGAGKRLEARIREYFESRREDE